MTVMQVMEERMDAYFVLLGRLSRNTAKLSSKVRYACRDVIECRANRWAKRGVALVEKYKTADEFREQEEKRARAAAAGGGGFHGGGGGGGGRGGGGKETPSNRGGGGGGGGGDFRNAGKSGSGGGKPSGSSTPSSKGSSSSASGSASGAPAKGGKPPGYGTLPAPKGKSSTSTASAGIAAPKLSRSKSGTGDEWQTVGGASKSGDASPSGGPSPQATPSLSVETHDGASGAGAGAPSSASTALSGAALVRRLTAIAEELSVTNDVSEARACLDEIAESDGLSTALCRLAATTLDKSGPWRKATATLLALAGDAELLALDDLVTELRSVAGSLADVAVDVPKIPQYFGEVRQLGCVRCVGSCAGL